MIEDAPVEARLALAYLRSEPYETSHVLTGQAGLDFLSENAVDVVLLDLNLPDMGGFEILEWIRDRELPVAVIILTGNASLEVAVSAMRKGAFDYLVKPYNAERLKITLRNAMERQALNTLVEDYRDEFGGGRYCGFIGASPAMQAVYRTIESAAASKASVFITGESGTGKELCAEAVHQRSPRRDAPFLALNCAAIPRDLMESQIFGHVKGAFTGATADNPGAAGHAHGGTLFLDEICDMPLELQAKLLRFVQTGGFQKVGSPRTEKVEVRFICATNRDPVEEVAAGRLREDLFYRMHVIPLPLPPLRQREDDVILIARHLLVREAREEGKQFTRFSPQAEDMLRAYSWPGNVRQLENVIRQIVVLHDGETVSADILPPPLPQGRAGQGAVPAFTDAGETPPLTESGPESDTDATRPPIQPLWQTERDAILRAIELCDGNIPRAARSLRINPSTIYRKRHSWEGMETSPAAADTAPGLYGPGIH